jgi:hypothetical protein
MRALRDVRECKSALCCSFVLAKVSAVVKSIIVPSHTRFLYCLITMPLKFLAFPGSDEFFARDNVKKYVKKVIPLQIWPIFWAIPSRMDRKGAFSWQLVLLGENPVVRKDFLDSGPRSG